MSRSMVFEVYLSTEGITKVFPGVKALDNVNISIRTGEITSLVGENGAGKSTLVKIISGVYGYDKGKIFIKGKEIKYKSPLEALLKYKIACVHQDSTLIPEMSVVENFFLEIENKFYRMGLISYSEMRTELKKFLNELNFNDIDVDLKAKYLKPHEAKLIEFAKALYHDPTLLILDEVTAPLSRHEVDLIFEHVKDLKKSGKAILFISHRLAEVTDLSDRVIVLREGKVAGVLEGNNIERDQIIRLMIGKEVTLSQYFPPRAIAINPGKKILVVKNLKGNGIDVSFDLREGEILVFAGLGGQGMSEVLRMLCGILPKESGDIYLDGRKIEIKNPRDAIRHGIIYISENRELEELFTNLTVKDNISIPILDRCCRKNIIIRKRLDEAIKNVIQAFDIKTPSLDSIIMQLSGGNRQKVIIGRYMIKEPRVFLFANPTVGLDIKTKMEVYRTLRDLANRGIGIIAYLSELPEVVNLPDRVLVMHSGRIIKELVGSEITEENVLKAYFGAI
jgi:ABC-type sugar transport system ATPase subunit